MSSREASANFRVFSDPVTPFGIPTGALRAPGTNGVSFVMQSFIDEIAVAAGKDPLQSGSTCWRARWPAARRLAVPASTPRVRAACWKPCATCRTGPRASLPKGTAQGCAFQFAHAGYVAYVAEVSIGADKKVKINKAWAAVDVGRQIVNPSTSINLVQGGFIEAMSHLMAWEITIDKGRVVQNNFGQPSQPA